MTLALICSLILNDWRIRRLVWHGLVAISNHVTTEFWVFETSEVGLPTYSSPEASSINSHPLEPALLLLFSHQHESNSLWPHGQQHARLPCPSLSPRVCSRQKRKDANLVFSPPSSSYCYPSWSIKISSDFIVFLSPAKTSIKKKKKFKWWKRLYTFLTGVCTLLQKIKLLIKSKEYISNCWILGINVFVGEKLREKRIFFNS